MLAVNDANLEKQLSNAGKLFANDAHPQVD